MINFYCLSELRLGYVKFKQQLQIYNYQQRMKKNVSQKSLRCFPKAKERVAERSERSAQLLNNISLSIRQ